MTKRTYKIEVETIKSGQPRPYADSEYEYIVQTEGMSDWMVERFCTCVLRPCNKTYSQWSSKTGDASTYFIGYYNFEKISEKTYKYYVREPYDD